MDLGTSVAAINGMAHIVISYALVGMAFVMLVGGLTLLGHALKSFVEERKSDPNERFAAAESEKCRAADFTDSIHVIREVRGPINVLLLQRRAEVCNQLLGVREPGLTCLFHTIFPVLSTR